MSESMITNRTLKISARQATIAVALLGFVIIFVRTAWICDDAFITLRVVDNFVNGYGLVWNTDERVQAFTHPLWLLLLVPFYAVTREPYYTTLAVSGLIAAATVAMLLSSARSIWLALLAAVLLTGSKAFVDFSSSGLENPLSHLLIVGFVLAYVHSSSDQARSFRLNLLACASAGLIMLNRLDLALIILPALAVCLVREKRWKYRLLMSLVTFGPLVAWLLFSLFYYGFPLPNTYYAKQSAGIPRTEYWVRGVAYLVDLLIHDIFTLSVIVAGLAFAFLGARRRITWPLGLGILAYSGYVLWIGGDFMRGRFFSPVFVMSTACIILSLQGVSITRPLGGLAMISVLGLSLLTKPEPTWASGYPYPKVTPSTTSDVPITRFVAELLGRPEFNSLCSHIFDERGYYYATTGLLPHLLGQAHLEESFAVRTTKSLRQFGTRVIVFYGIGIRGFYAGPQMKIIDQNALADAFLARLPHGNPAAWRIGHITRAIPDGYITTRLYGRNSLSDPHLRSLYDDLSLVSRDLSLRPERLAAIARLNLYPPKVDLVALQKIPHDLSRPQFSAAANRVPEEGLIVFMDAEQQPLPLTMLLMTDPHTSYTLKLSNDWGDASQEWSINLPASDPAPLSPNVVVHFIELAPVSGAQYNLLRLVPANPSQQSFAGYFRFLDERSLERPNMSVQSGIVLSTATPSLIHTPTTIDVFAGLWWSDAPIAHELDLALTFVTCDTSGSKQIVIRINRQVLTTLSLTPQICENGWRSIIPLKAHLVKQNWNLLEIYAEQPTRIRLDKVHPKALLNP